MTVSFPRQAIPFFPAVLSDAIIGRSAGLRRDLRLLGEGSLLLGLRRLA